MRKQAVARLEIETELRRAIDDGQLMLQYQPQVSLVTNRLTGFEALVRWNHPERGMIPPCEFIPVAEETDLIIPLGAWVLKEACRQMAEWQSRFSSSPPLTIAVNVSYKQLTVAGFVESVSAVLRETGLAAASLRLEITESVVMKDPEESIETLNRLKGIGVGLEIDDFGTGYSSLSYLSSLPFDMVKIDRSFVTGLGTPGDRGEIVRSILELARSLGLDVIAEGVETEGELQKLLTLGCARAQGFYFSKPMDREAVPALVEVENLKRAFRQLEGRTEDGKMLQLSASAAGRRDVGFNSAEQGAATEAETLAHSL
jgi:Amt family ammonium transporter